MNRSAEGTRSADSRLLIGRSTPSFATEPDLHGLYESVPLFLVLEPDAPRYTIVAVSDAYLRAMRTKRKDILGRGLLDVLTDNRLEVDASELRNLSASFERVIRNRVADAMAIQRYDVRRERGGFEERFWTPVNSPVFAPDGALTYIIHRVEDVTESRHLEQVNHDALIREMNRYRELFESAPDGIFIAGPDGRYTDVNAAGCRLLGYAREELIGRSIVELVAPEELPRHAALARHLLGGGTDVSEWLLRRKDGTYVPVELSSNALPDGHLRALVRDVTERNAADEARRLSEAKLWGIVSSSADAIISIDEAQRITMFNEGAESIFGYSRAEIIGSPLEALIPERFRQNHRQQVDKLAKGEDVARRMGTRSTELYGLRKNGEEFPADAAISALEIGRERLLTVSLRDVSERKRAADDQRLLAEVGRVLVAAGPDFERLLNDVARLVVHKIGDWCRVDVRAGNVRRLRIVHAEPAMAATCEALERCSDTRNEPGPFTVVVETERSVLMADLPPEWPEPTPDSAEYPRLMRALDLGSLIVVPLRARGQIVGTLGLGASRTSRRYCPADVRLVEELADRVALAVDNARLHDALERAVRAREEVLGIVAHDLRNPLNSIVLHARALRRRESERRDQRATESIHRAAVRMDRLIHDLLDIARLEAGERLSVELEALDTSSVLAEAIEQHQATLYGRAIDLEVTAEPCSVYGDRTRLLQVFDNLLANAIKFTRGRITLGAVPKDREILFWVSDNGPGISPEALPHVFDRFWQSTRGDRRGVGLGLSIVKEIVAAHGGRVWAESDVGGGTRFYLTLPVGPKGPKEGSP